MKNKVYWDFNNCYLGRDILNSSPEELDMVSADFIKDRFDNRNSEPKKWTKFVLNNKNKFVLIDEDEVNPWQNDVDTELENVKIAGAFIPLGDEKLVKQVKVKLDEISDLLNKEGNGLDTGTMLDAIVDIQKEINSMFCKEQTIPTVLENESETKASPICYVEIQNLLLTEQGKEQLQESLEGDDNIFFLDFREDENDNVAVSVLMNKDKYCDEHNLDNGWVDYTGWSYFPVLDQCFDNKWIDTKGMALDEDSDLPFDYSCSTVERVEQNDLNGEYLPYYQKEISDTQNFGDRDYLKDKLEEYVSKNKEREI